jgi:hypothetical protein
MHFGILLSTVQKGRGLLNVAKVSPFPRLWTSAFSMSSSSGTTDVVLSWSDLQDKVGTTAVGTALNNEVKLRSQGKGSAHVQNKLRKFDSNEEPAVTLFRDHAGWYVSLSF